MKVYTDQMEASRKDGIVIDEATLPDDDLKAVKKLELVMNTTLQSVRGRAFFVIG